jgi:hypothetical protein
MIEHDIFIYGGFDQEAPNIPTESTLKLDLNKAFNTFPALFKALAFGLGKDVFTVAHQTNPMWPTRPTLSSRAHVTT